MEGLPVLGSKERVHFTRGWWGRETQLAAPARERVSGGPCGFPGLEILETFWAVLHHPAHFLTELLAIIFK